MEMPGQQNSHFGGIFSHSNPKIFDFNLIVIADGLFHRFMDLVVENLLDLSLLEYDVIYLLMKKLLSIQVEIVVVLGLASGGKQLFPKLIFSFVEVFTHFEML